MEAPQPDRTLPFSLCDGIKQIRAAIGAAATRSPTLTFFSKFCPSLKSMLMIGSVTMLLDRRATRD
jgi:hypothetical protein